MSFKDEWKEDLHANVLNLDEEAENFIYKAATGAVKKADVPGRLSEAALGFVPEFDGEFSDRTATLVVATDDVPAPQQGETFTAANEDIWKIDRVIERNFAFTRIAVKCKLRKTIGTIRKGK